MHDIHTIEYEKGRYKALVQHLELKFKLKFNYDSIEDLPVRKKTMIMQRLATSLLFGHFMAADPIKYPIGTVEPEYVPKRSQAAVTFDSNGAVCEKFHISQNQYVLSGDVMEAMETHFRSEERLKRITFDDKVKSLNRQIQVAPPLPQGAADGGGLEVL